MQCLQHSGGGGVLRIRVASGDYLPVAYKSRKLTRTKQQLPIHDKELCAIYHCCLKFCCYIEGLPNVEVLTDHKSLVYFKTQSHLNRTQAKWLRLLESLNLDIQYKQGPDMNTADALSRISLNYLYAEGLDPNWPLFFTYSPSKLPAEVSGVTKKQLYAQASNYVVKNGVVH